MPHVASATAAAATPVTSLGRIFMAVFLQFRRPPVGRAERAEPAAVAIRL
jgi:hypothetical protein